MKIQTKIIWERSPEEKFLKGDYKRTHRWITDGGLIIEASASPEVVPIPMSDPSLIDPEEAFISSISSCHMLFFLSIAAKKKIIIDAYEDNPIAFMGKNEAGKMSVLYINLYPKIQFGNLEQPAEKTIKHIHEIAHANCFLANSVVAKISIH